MAEAVSRRPLTPQARVLSLISPRDICGGHGSCGTGLSPSIPVFPCQYRSTSVPQSSSYTCCSYQKVKRAKSGNLTKAMVSRKSGSIE